MPLLLIRPFTLRRYGYDADALMLLHDFAIEEREQVRRTLRIDDAALADAADYFRHAAALFFLMRIFRCHAGAAARLRRRPDATIRLLCCLMLLHAPLMYCRHAMLRHVSMPSSCRHYYAVSDVICYFSAAYCYFRQTCAAYVVYHYYCY